MRADISFRTARRALRIRVESLRADVEDNSTRRLFAAAFQYFRASALSIWVKPVDKQWKRVTEKNEAYAGVPVLVSEAIAAPSE